MTITPDSLIKNSDILGSLPGIGVRVNQMIDDPSYTSTDIGQVIAQDPALTARLLKIANSPAVGFSKKIDTVTRAITVLGSRHIRDLVLGTSVVRAMQVLPNKLISMEDFWTHSICCGLAARSLAEPSGLINGETLFVAGLLHDIGHLLIFHQLPDKAQQALELSAHGDGKDEVDLHKAEQEIMGFDHASVGAALLRQWHFPEVLVECVQFHHTPQDASKFPLQVALVHVANSLAVLAEINILSKDNSTHIDPITWQILNLNPDTVETVLRTVQEQFTLAKEIIL